MPIKNIEQPVEFYKGNSQWFGQELYYDNSLNENEYGTLIMN